MTIYPSPLSQEATFAEEQQRQPLQFPLVVPSQLEFAKNLQIREWGSQHDTFVHLRLLTTAIVARRPLPSPPESQDDSVMH